MDETDELCGTPEKTEPMDETDELCGTPEKTEPMDETDESKRETGSWHEIPGHGLLKYAAGGRGVRYHPWCSWTERAELLSTFTCARRLRIDSTRSITVRPISPAGSEMIGLDLASRGQVIVEAEAALFDGNGRLLAEPAAGEPLWLEAGRFFLRVGTDPGGDAAALDFEMD